MRRLDRYIFFEILGPLGLGFVLFTFILLLSSLFKLADLIIRRGVPAEEVARLLSLSLPSIVVLTIPMSLLFAILIAVGRLSADSELIAIRASGVSLFSLYRPILFLSLLLTGLNLYVSLEALPRSNHAFQQMRVGILAQSLSQEVEPRTFYPGWQERLLYVFERPPSDQRWKGAFLADAIPLNDDEVFVAEWGEALTDRESSNVKLFLERAYNHRVDFANPDRYDVILHNEVTLGIETPGENRSRDTSGRGMRELELDELRQHADDATLPVMARNRAKVEIHKKFSIPMACLVFGLLALPLGFSKTNRSGGRSAGFALSLLVVLGYYVLLNWGEEMAIRGDIAPWLGVWFSNFTVLVIGLYLVARKNRDKSLLLADLDRWVQEHLWRRINRVKDVHESRRASRLEQRSNKRHQADLVLRLPQLQLRFPNQTDRYILGQFFRVLIVAQLVCLTIYIIADLSDKADELFEQSVAFDVVLTYYQYKVFAILYQIAPVIMLISTLFTFGLLSRSNEITAFKAAGVSLYRMSLPVVLAAILLSALAGVFQSEVLAASNARLATLEAQIKGRPPKPQIRRADRRWLYGKGDRLVNYLHFDAERDQIHRLQVFRFDERYRLTDRLVVDRASHLEEDWWLLEGGWTRSFEGTLETSYETFTEPRRYRLGLTPEALLGETPAPDEMTYAELRTHIDELQEAGKAVPELEIELHNKIAYPAISLVMALVALPFSFRLGRRGALYGVGLGLLLSIALMAALAAFTALGRASVLPPLVAVWSPGTIFSIFSLYLFLGVRT